MKTVTIWDLANRFVGIREVPGKVSNALVLAMLQLDSTWPQDDEVPWCSAFVNYLAWMMRLPRSKRLNARSWLGVGTPVDEPEVGDVVVFWRGDPEGAQGHVGLFAGWGENREKVLVLGGNQNNEVNISAYPASRLLGFRRL